VTLATNGDHTVSVSSDDSAAVTDALVWARDTHRKLLRFPRPPRQESHSVSSRNGTPEADSIEPPVCEVHQIPMVRVEGRRGAFWSCHQRNEDGSFCSYKPRA
jgi:hypothetical protein